MRRRQSEPRGGEPPIAHRQVLRHGSSFHFVHCCSCGGGRTLRRQSRLPAFRNGLFFGEGEEPSLATGRVHARKDDASSATVHHRFERGAGRGTAMVTRLHRMRISTARAALSESIRACGALATLATQVTPQSIGRHNARSEPNTCKRNARLADASKGLSTVLGWPRKSPSCGGGIHSIVASPEETLRLLTQARIQCRLDRRRTWNAVGSRVGGQPRMLFGTCYPSGGENLEPSRRTAACPWPPETPRDASVQAVQTAAAIRRALGPHCSVPVQPACDPIACHCAIQSNRRACRRACGQAPTLRRRRTAQPATAPRAGQSGQTRSGNEDSSTLAHLARRAWQAQAPRNTTNPGV